MHAITAASFVGKLDPKSQDVTERTEGAMDRLWVFEDSVVDWNKLSRLYRIAPLGEKSAADLKTAFSNSKFKCFVYSDGELIAAGRCLADGIDCSYIADVAVHPEVQGTGIGTALINKLVELSQGHEKIILYAEPGTEPFYHSLGFHQMNTAMGIWRNHALGVSGGFISDND